VSSRSGAVPTPPSRAWLWAVLWLIAAAALAALAARGAAPRSSWLATGVRSAILDTALILLALWLAWLTRRVLLVFMAARAGPVEISVRDSVTPDALAAFRKALTAVYLSSPSAVPGESSSRDFFSDVREAAAAKSAWGVALLAVASVFRVGAYHVSCAAGNAPDGLLALTIEISSRLGREAQVTTVSGRTWDDVAQRAACHVAAYVLPRTSLSRKPPWTPWHHCQLKPDLLYHFQEARRLAQAGCLEESLSHFDQATELDPLNPYIRIEKATVLEQLRLYIDALATYVDVMIMESWYDRKLWDRYRRIFKDKDSWTAAPPRLRRSPSGPAAVQLARYRVVCSLAGSQRVAEQWHRYATSDAGPRKGHACESGAMQPKRSQEALRVIKMLQPFLKPFYQEMMDEYRARSDKSSLRKIPDLRRIEQCEPMLRRVMQYAALREARDLEKDYRWYRLRRWRGELLISRFTMRILPAWASFLYRYVERAQSRERWAPGEQVVPDLRGRYLPLRVTRSSRGLSRRVELKNREWPPDVRLVKDCVRWALGSRVARRGSLEHYSAACTFAVGMLTPELYMGAETLSLGEDSAPPDAMLGDALLWTLTKAAAMRDYELVGHAISQLSQAVTAGDSQFTGGASPWLRRGDMDLDNLRVTPRYATFVDRYLSPGASWPPVPPNVALLTVNAHVLQLVNRVCKARQALWEERARSTVPTAWADIASEAEVWKLLGDYCLNYRDWRTRHEFICAASQSASAATALDTSILKLEDDSGWVSKNDQARVEPEPGFMAVTYDAWVLHLVRSWLQYSRSLERGAVNLISVRNCVLWNLGRNLNEPSLGNALAEAARTAQLTASPPMPGSAALLANTWRALAQDTELTRHNSGQLAATPPWLTRLREHFRLHPADAEVCPERMGLDVGAGP
jgi:hypothetical protein